MAQKLEEMAQKTTENRALIVFMTGSSRVLLHLPIDDLPELTDSISKLPEGMRLWECYVMAHEAYLSGEYEKSLGIVETCLSLSLKIYPIAMIYLHLKQFRPGKAECFRSGHEIQQEKMKRNLFLPGDNMLKYLIVQ